VWLDPVLSVSTQGSSSVAAEGTAGVAPSPNASVPTLLEDGVSVSTTSAIGVPNISAT
jgi:hypothetical protein